MNRSHSRVPLALIALAGAGCGTDRRPGPDVVPPAAVTDLRVHAFGTSTLLLDWLAPGDDNRAGQARSYEVRYSRSPLTPSNFNSGTLVAGLPAPGPAGTASSVAIPGLATDTDYSIAQITRDEADNASSLSNVVQARTAARDEIPPAPIHDLTARAVSNSAIRLAWTATGDDSSFGRARAYDIRYGKSPISPANWANADSIARPPTPRAAGQPESLTVAALTRGTTYHFALRARDEVAQVSPAAQQSSVTTGLSPRVWRVFVDGSGDAATIQAAIQAASDDDTVLVGPGTYYEAIRFGGRNVVLRSSEGPDRTILDGSRLDTSIIQFVDRETDHAVVEGFTLTRGVGTLNSSLQRRGGAIYCIAASPKILACRFAHNELPWERGQSGGAIYVGYADSPGLPAAPRIESCRFEYNSAGSNGGAIGIQNASVSLINNEFFKNRAQYDGGAVWYAVSAGVAIVTENTFVENHAGDHGGGGEIGAVGGVPPGRITVQYNVFIRNSADGLDSGWETGTGGALSLRGARGSVRHNTIVSSSGTGFADCTGGGILTDSSMERLMIEYNIIVGSSGCGLACYYTIPEPRLEEIRNNLFWQNLPGDLASGTRACPPDGVSGNVFADPLFCDPAHDDYRLDASSPARLGKEVMGAFDDAGCGPPRIGFPRK